MSQINKFIDKIHDAASNTPAEKLFMLEKLEESLIHNLRLPPSTAYAHKWDKNIHDVHYGTLKYFNILLSKTPAFDFLKVFKNRPSKNQIEKFLKNEYVNVFKRDIIVYKNTRLLTLGEAIVMNNILTGTNNGGIDKELLKEFQKDARKEIKLAKQKYSP